MITFFILTVSTSPNVSQMQFRSFNIKIVVDVSSFLCLVTIFIHTTNCFFLQVLVPIYGMYIDRVY